jgi:hypothetical protein
MRSLDRMLEWFPNTRREWIELIIAAILLCLLMMTAVYDPELLPVGWTLTGALPPTAVGFN